jgi:hypothetical protein
MNDRFDDLLYLSGLTAQGSWDNMDQYDQQAIQRLFELTVLDCVNQVTKLEHHSCYHISHMLKNYYGIDS